MISLVESRRNGSTAARMTPSADPALAVLCAGTEQIITRDDLAARLALKRPLRIKLGVDPTSPDIHLGHTIAFEKLRQFQELGHKAVLIIGDFTATVGDPSGRTATRPPLSREEVLANAETYTAQAFKVLDRERTEIVHNGDWFRDMTYGEILRLNARVTLQQMLQREDFRTRLDQGREVRLHEIQYPIMQGWDSVVVRADVELGGTDQLFNILVGRDPQREEGQPPQVAMLLPLLEGLDGRKKMSKSYDNYVGVSDPPGEMFAKLMSISDELMDRYYLLLLGESRDPSLHPMDAKKQLASRLTARYHDESRAQAARADWEARFSKRDPSAAKDLPELPVASLPPDLPLLQLVSQTFESVFGLRKSNSEIRRQFIITGAVQLNGEKLTDPSASVTLRRNDILRLSKKHSVRAT